MLIRKPADISPSEITDRALYLERRRFLQRAGLMAAAAAGVSLLSGCEGSDARSASSLPPPGGKPIPNRRPGPYSTDETPTPFEDAASYNNFYEFGTGKDDPARYAGSLKTAPWSVTIDGECERPGTYALEDLLQPHPLEDRVYRLRCVEAWSMVIPWVGFPLGDLLKRFGPTSKAKYVAFATLYDPAQMPGQRRPILDWPYREGLRIDEAMHPLTLLAVGMYGETLPNQNGAPLRLVVPWKYGYKSIKSIVRISFTETQPKTAWNSLQPEEYGFYSNVNPAVDHPRWSQKRERRIGEWRRRETLPFNGYAEQVADLYRGMDLSIFI
ncbi:MAG TPA: protein-methionine-sulfoxide reductase catalytic subunit MsrP [Sedimenticola sp.]|nr:protein-methionine-sulfoxide reductase catalytic subunit MsrP [Sedimenticola sp.]